jgi:predicted transcriptional regulator
VDRLLLDDIFVFVALIVGMGCLTGVVITMLKRRGRALPSDLAGRLDDIANRLNRLDTSVDTIAVEVERISEAQRFTAKVLADRSAGSVLPERSRSGATPH